MHRPKRNVLLVVENARSGIETLYALGQIGQRAWVLPLSSACKPLASSRWCVGFAPCTPPTRGEDLKSAIARAVESTHATHIIPDLVTSFLALSEMAGELGSAIAFPTPPPGLLRELDNKASFSLMARAFDLPIVESKIAIDEADAKSHCLSYPVVLKPLDSLAGIGIRYCADEESLETELSKWPAYPQLVERYVPGNDVHLSFLSSDGELVAWEVHEPHSCDAIRYRACRFYRDEQALEVGLELARALKYTGIANLDFRRDSSGKLWLLECNPRLYGRMAMAAKAGVNFIEIGLDLADGVDFGKPVAVREQVVYSPLALPSLLRQGHASELVPSAIAGAIGIALSDPMLTADLALRWLKNLSRARTGSETLVHYPLRGANTGAGTCP